MNNLQNEVKKILNFDTPSRMPVVEWCLWWDKTITSWEEQGMPTGMDSMSLYEYFGLNKNIQFWLDHYSEYCPKPEHQSKGLIENVKDYRKIRPHILKQNAALLLTNELKSAQQMQQNGEAVAWYTINGFFWFPRELFGIENHLFSFYDHPLLYHQICEDLLKWQISQIDELNRYVRFELMTIAEDMSYNSGPMISQNLFNKFIAPYYKKLVPHIQKYGTKVFVDTDGDVTDMIPWLLDCGVDGIFPLERQAGVDVVHLREQFPTLLMIGGFNKMCVLKGEDAIRAEMNRLRPVVEKGGYLPALDHQTPPGTKLEDYKTYIKCLRDII